MIMLAHMCAPLLLYSFTAPIQSSIPHNLFSANFPNEIPSSSQMKFRQLPKYTAKYLAIPLIFINFAQDLCPYTDTRK